MIADSKKDYFQNRINSSSDSQSYLFQCVKEPLHHTKPGTIPTRDSPKETSNKIANYFTEKIKIIRSSLEDIQLQCNLPQPSESKLIPGGCLWNHLNQQ